jgi:hypothetical protein
VDQDWLNLEVFFFSFFCSLFALSGVGFHQSFPEVLPVLRQPSEVTIQISASHKRKHGPG